MRISPAGGECIDKGTIKACFKADSGSTGSIEKPFPITPSNSPHSSQRNKPALAVRETTDLFEGAGRQIEFELRAAPLRECSEVVEIV